ncbi:cytochrome P450, family 708, subfamily A, polypeptide 3 [Actinidia rufa]|uniref:Cytochrome P450, family 708, subfamily A, polypeptide 3 n=1 Tax=Actinidia rufa TaxID=165716 RepID=A0A7J0F2M0_9ERIC|nr:cytochrome P450, family 708, subfamily A, polypeptide 3 [Actinidia rufa]
MGLPIIGESIQYFSPYTEFDTPTFIKERTKRYGSLFRTSLVGKPIVVSTDPEINHYIFQQEGRYFQCYYTESFTKILGDQNSMLAYHGVFHKYLKNLILKLTGRENLKGKLIHEMDVNTCRCLHSWTSHESVNVKEAIAEMIFEYSAKHLFGYVDKEGLKKLKENYIAFSDGLISFPLNVPGTAYHAYSLSTTVTLATKFIADHPLVLAELTVINETVRLGNIAPMILRKVTKDVELKGYTVPSGWLVMVSTLSTHLDPTMHEDPLSFNPWRWEGQELHAGSKNFMAFGGGVRLCVGAEFAKLQTAIFIHHLVSKYRWEITGGGDTIRRPSVTFPKGLYIQMSTKTRK